MVWKPFCLPMFPFPAMVFTTSVSGTAFPLSLGETLRHRAWLVFVFRERQDRRRRPLVWGIRDYGFVAYSGIPCWFRFYRDCSFSLTGFCYASKPVDQIFPAMSVAAEPEPRYGVVDHYLGERGEEYLEWQGRLGRLESEFNKHFWEPYLSEKDEVLDFGCGRGYLLEAFSVKRGVGIEINSAARAEAKERGIETFATVEEVPGMFDKVISSHTLEHISHPRRALMELKSKLRDEESRIVLLLPLDDWRSRGNRRYRASDMSMHLHTWTPQLLGNLLRSADLEIHEVRITCHAWPPGSRMLWHFSPFLFHRLAFFWSILVKRRQLFAVAGPPRSSVAS